MVIEAFWASEILPFRVYMILFVRSDTYGYSMVCMHFLHCTGPFGIRGNHDTRTGSVALSCGDGFAACWPCVIQVNLMPTSPYRAIHYISSLNRISSATPLAVVSVPA